MNVTVESAIQSYLEKGYPIVAESLGRLRNYIVAGRWRDVYLDNIGYCGSNGISLHIDYYHVLFHVSIVTSDKFDIVHDYSHRTNSISIETWWSFDRGYVPISCLNSLLNKIVSQFPNCCIYDHVITINEANEKAVDIFLNLCDLAHEMRINSNNEFKEYINEKKLKTCTEYPPIDYDAPF